MKKQEKWRLLFMKKYVMAGAAAVLAGMIITGFVYREPIMVLYRSIKAFQEENLAHSFQTMYEIQPTATIPKGEKISDFEYDLKPLIDTFHFQGETLCVSDFLEETKTSGLLIISDDKIVFEEYYLGSDEKTRFSSNSLCKSFVSALVGLAVEDGFIDSVDDSVAKYIPEFENTEIEKVTIKNCLHMASGINFDEVADMNKISVPSMFGKNKMKSIAALGLVHEPGTNRTYSSINTDILGEVVANATGSTLSEYMSDKIWSEIGVEQDAYWTLSGGKELANGGLHIALRDYARFARLYMNHGAFEGKQILPEQWIKDSIATNETYLKAPHDGKPYEELGYGYQWWIPEGNEHEFTGIGVFGQWIYCNPTKKIIVVKTGADSGFEEDDKEKKSVAFFREIAAAYGE